MIFGSFVGAFESFVTVVGEIFIAFVWMLPYLLIAAVVLVIVIVCNKKGLGTLLILFDCFFRRLNDIFLRRFLTFV
jgi:hypothetical protein